MGSGAFHRGLRGVEAAAVAGLAMIALLTSTPVLRGCVWWWPANLLGSTFYGSRALRWGPGWHTLAGYALHIFITGVVGALFGLTCGGLERRRRLLLMGALAGVLWYFLATAILWTWVNPLVPLYSLQPDTLVAHALFGACLGRMGQSEIEPVAIDPPPLPSAEGEPVAASSIAQSISTAQGVSTAQAHEDGVE